MEDSCLTAAASWALITRGMRPRGGHHSVYRYVEIPPSRHKGTKHLIETRRRGRKQRQENERRERRLSAWNNSGARQLFVVCQQTAFLFFPLCLPCGTFCKREDWQSGCIRVLYDVWWHGESKDKNARMNAHRLGPNHRHLFGVFCGPFLIKVRLTVKWQKGEGLSRNLTHMGQCGGPSGLHGQKWNVIFIIVLLLVDNS